MTSVRFVRHGMSTADMKVPKLFKGSRDYPLAPAGYRQAQEVAHLLELDPPAEIFTSDLARCAQFASVIAKYLGLEVTLDRESVSSTWVGGKASPYRQLRSTLLSRLPHGDEIRLLKSAVEKPAFC